MGPFLVVEYEVIAPQRTEKKLTALDIGILARRQRPFARTSHGCARRAIPKRLARIGERFAMHLFMERSKLREISELVMLTRVELILHAIEDTPQVPECFVKVGE